MVAGNKFNAFIANVMNKNYNMGSDALKVMLSNVAPVATNVDKADITEIAAGNGYSAGGAAVGITSSTQTAGTYKLIASGNTVFTASGGSIAVFRYAVFYDNTPGSGQLIGWWDYGSALTLNSGDSLTLQWDAANGILQAS